MPDKFQFTSRDDDPLTVRRAVFEALGAASVCWSETPGGVFDSERSEEIGEALLEVIATTQLASPPVAPDPRAVLALPMGPNDADAATVGEYLAALAVGVVTDGEEFSGKRPFGNSGWSGELYKPLIAAGFVAGKLDEDGYIDEIDSRAADALLIAAARAMGQVLGGESLRVTWDGFWRVTPIREGAAETSCEQADGEVNV